VLSGVTEILGAIPGLTLPGWVSWVLPVLGGVSATVYVVSVLWGFHLGRFVNKFEAWYGPRVERRYFRLAGEELPEQHQPIEGSDNG
jgi:hypothetical protein